MSFGTQRSQYFKDDNEFGRKAFMVAVVLAIVLIATILVWKGISALAYKADNETWIPHFKSYCYCYGYTFKDVKYLKEDGSTSERGIVFEVTNFRDSTQTYPGTVHVVLYGDGGYGYGASTWITSHYRIE